MKGKIYMDRIITLLRCSYKSLEIELEETPKPALTTKVKPVKQTSLNTATISNGYTSSSSSDGQGGPSTQTKQKKKKLKPPRTSGLTVVAVATPVVTASSLGCQEDEEGQTGQQTTLQFAPQHSFKTDEVCKILTPTTDTTSFCPSTCTVGNYSPDYSVLQGAAMGLSSSGPHWS